MATNKKGLDAEARVSPRIWALAITLAVVLFGALVRLIGRLLAEVIPPGWIPVIHTLLCLGVLVAVIRVFSQQPVRAVAWLTWKAAFRFRLFIVVAVLLLLAVVGLPMLLKDDGTARGFTQILLTYTLTTITALLGLSTLWLACGTLARDIEECQMQMVASKPIARWQIWLGKWLGIMSLNAALLALAGGSVYGLLLYRATKLPEAEQHVLKNEVLVARGSAKEASMAGDIEVETERQLQERVRNSPVSVADLPQVRNMIRERLKSEVQSVAPGMGRPWRIDLGYAKNYLVGRPLYLRLKFNSAEKSPSGTFGLLLQVGEPQKSKNLWATREPLSLAPDTFHEIEIPEDLFNNEGILTILAINPNNTTLLFPLDEGMEVLYRESGFGLNYLRGLGIIFCWMALLATLGLAAASFLSFPVAAFCSLAVLMMGLSSGTLATAITDGTVMGFDEESGKAGASVVDGVAIPVFKLVLTVINLAKDFSPVEALSTGRSITWTELARAVVQIILVMGGIMAAVGIWAFTRRELATAQNQS